MVTSTISVLLCTYNGEKYINELLESLLAQTVQPNEVVICDDGSSDQTLQIISEWKRRVPFPVRVVRNEQRLHFTGNFLRGIGFCSEEVIAFCDQDDIWLPDKLSECLLQLQAFPKADVLMHAGEVIGAYGEAVGKSLPSPRDLNVCSMVAPFDKVAKGFAMVIRRRRGNDLLAGWSWKDYELLLEKFGVPLGHDVLLVASCVGAKTYTFLAKPLVRYRIHGSNVTATNATTLRGWRRVVDTVSNLNFDFLRYSEPAAKWKAESEFVDALAARSDSVTQIGLRQLSDWLTQRAQAWQMRSLVYDTRVSRCQRLSEVWSLITQGRYRYFGAANLLAMFLSATKDAVFVLCSRANHVTR